ncbi:YihY/virulence factor BrkB family protein [Haloplanus rubicundus]|uniref:YihY/virulence factor BrkB family protein n=1 Tax=Haloplanus rubicundus TaxID=1547898 RepID=A0A345E8Z3_9EURY|nr:YihY/virulence factor BrkB family protein [Haloplanus rubicundus]AXG08665.1 YihY/virulence factor BrkB family protein [Haloplanus rubicundus]
MSARSRLALVRTVVREVQARDATLLAASIAYYAFVSLLPLLVLTTVVATVLGGTGLRTAVLGLADRYLLPVGQDLVGEALANTTGRGGVTFVGLLLLLWSSLKLFRGIDTAFARIYGTPARDFLGSLRIGATVLAAVGVGSFGGVVLVGVVALLRTPVALLAPLAFFVVLVAALFPVYYLTPTADLAPREALPGTLFCAGGWTIFGTAFALYAAIATTSGRFALYGALGAILLLVTWFYLAGLVLLVGATINAVRADRLTDSDRQVQHPPDRDDVTTAMTGDDKDPSPAPDIEDLADRVDEVREDLDAFEADVEDRTVDRPALESELKAYVRRRMRRGHARGWGPYLVLLYGTVMTLGAFYLLSDLVALVAMIVIFLSTLGLYVLFVIFGAGLSLLGKPGQALDSLRRFRR